MMQRTVSIIPLLLFSFCSMIACADDDVIVGLSKTAPGQGLFVKTDQGYMVPYKVTLPNSKVEFEMLPIPGGTFVMGSPKNEKGHLKGEGPQVEVTVEPFWMGRCEVRWAEYRQFMNLYNPLKTFVTKKIRVVKNENRADAITVPTPLYDPSTTFQHGDHPDLPAVTMTQYAAKQYTKWLTGTLGVQYRLPSSAEWEYACRGGAKTAFHFGDDPSKLHEYGWSLGNSDGAMQKVGQKKPNQFGLHDMHGNVWEWVLDEQTEDGYQRLAGKNNLKAVDTIAWPTKLDPRLLRGGSWDDSSLECRSASMLGSNIDQWKDTDPINPKSPWWFTDSPAHSVGFRLLRPLNELSKEEMVKYWEPDCELMASDVDARLEEGRGVLGLVDKDLPAALKKLDE